MKQQYLQILIVGFLGGVFVNNVLGEEVLSIILLLFLCTIIGTVIIYMGQYRHILFPLFLGAIIGIVCSGWMLQKIENNKNILADYQFSSGELTATIIDIQKRDSDSVEYKARLESLEGRIIERQTSIHTVVRIPANFDLIPGDTIRYMSKIYFIEDFDGFNYENYMLSKNIYFRSYAPTFQRISSGNVSPLFITFFHIRSNLLEKLSRLYPGEEKIFLAGILLGAREDIPSELKTHFNNSGLTHFIAVSGFNITILVIFFGYIFRFFPIHLRTFLVLTSIILFTILVGFGAPVVRAAIMGMLAYVILTSGRKASSIVLVGITACLMVAVSPLSLNYDVSLHLSFLAVIGIIYTQGFFKKMFGFLPETLAIREAFVLTLSALSLTIPIMMFQFGQISLLSPVANIMVTWTIPIAMLLGFLSLIGYILFPLLGYVLAFLDWIFLKFDIMMVHFFGQLDFALIHFDFGIYSTYLQIFYFLILLFLIIVFQKYKKRA